MSDSLISSLGNVAEKYWFYSNVFLLTFGVTGNLALVLIFVTLRIFRGSQCAFYFIVESFANIGVLLLTTPSIIYNYVTGEDSTVTSLVWCKVQSSMLHTFGLCSLFTTCFLTFDQYMSTNPRPHFRQISSLKLAHGLTLVNVCLVLLHSIPFLIFTEIRPVELCTIYNGVLYAYFTYFYYPILSATIPLLITITFSLLAFRNVRRIIRRQLNIFRRRLDRQLTGMVLARVFCLILFGAPYIIYALYRINLSVTKDDQVKLAIIKLVSRILYSILYMNYAVKSKVLSNEIDFDLQ